jgi:hypothetical protein
MSAPESVQSVGLSEQDDRQLRATVVLFEKNVVSFEQDDVERLLHALLEQQHVVEKRRTDGRSKQNVGERERSDGDEHPSVGC